MEMTPAAKRPAGVPNDCAAAVVDHYAIEDADVSAAAMQRPVLAIFDGDLPPPATISVNYHLDARRRVRSVTGTRLLLGPDYAPIEAGLSEARRERPTLRHILVVPGGGSTGVLLANQMVDAAAMLGAELIELWGHPALEGAASRARAATYHGVSAGLREPIARADAAIAGAGVTAYELACAGVPALLVVLADHQAPIASAFARAGASLTLDARYDVSIETIEREVRRLAHRPTRVRLAQVGPRLVDGQGAGRLAKHLADLLSQAATCESPARSRTQQR